MDIQQIVRDQALRDQRSPEQKVVDALTTELTAVKKERDDIIRDAFINNSEFDEYIASLKWSEDATDYQKTLVIGNLSAFAAFFNRKWESLHGPLAEIDKEMK